MDTVFNKIYRKIFTSTRFYKFNYSLYELSLRTLGVLNYENFRVTGEEHFVTKILPKLVKKELPVFFDVGANIGTYSIFLQKRFPGAALHLFEPQRENYQQLIKLNNSQMVVYPIAVGCKNESLTLYDVQGSGGTSHASLFRNVITDIHGKAEEAETVQVKTLDSIASEQHISFIDFLKIDTEGNELNVLLGATGLLKSKSIGCIQFEFNEMNVVSRCFFLDFCRVLEGFSLFRMLPKGLIEIHYSPIRNELFAFQNILAIPTENKSRLYS